MPHRDKFEVVPLTEVLRATGVVSAPATTPQDAARPVSGNPAQAPATDPQQPLPPQATSAKVLVVDDEHIIADSLAAILHSKGYDASAFYDGESALDACQSAVPDCLISDVVMPGISGFDLAVKVRQRFPHCRILLFSGQASTVDLIESHRSTGQRFELLTKPVHPNDLLARLENRRPIPPGARSESAFLPEQRQA